MLLKEILRMALASLGVHKLRSFLTMAGITIGVFSVIGVMTAVSALRGSIETGLSYLGANTFQFSKYPSFRVGGSERAKYDKRRNISLAQARRYQKLMEGTASAVCLGAFNPMGGQAIFENRQTTPGIRYFGSNEYFLQTEQYTIDVGRNLTAEDFELGRPVVIIGQTVVGKLFPSQSPLGKTIRINGHVYSVIGTFAAKGRSFGQDLDNTTLVPLTRFLSDNGADRYSITIDTQASSAILYNETLDKGITAMRIARGLRPADENDFETHGNDSLVAAFATVADSVRAGAFVISAIALVAAGVGIMNIMLVSVTERTKEIGVRKSIGARKTNILTQFLIEAVALSVAGGLVGIAMGVAAGDAVALALHADIVFPWGWAAAGLAVCTAIGIGFGLYPALRAAALDPIEALRYE